MKTLLIANLSLNSNTPPNGVNVKNRHILNFLNDNTEKLKVIDTDNWRKQILSLALKIMVYSFFADKIIISINSNNAYRVIKYLNFVGMEQKVDYFVIGGSFHKSVKEEKFNKKYYKNLKNIYVETEEMYFTLRKLELEQAQVVPNFKKFTQPKFNKQLGGYDILNGYYIGRIQPEKGIEMIFQLLEKVNADKIKLKVDFFGPVEPSYQSRFKEQIKVHKETRYKGILDLSQNNSYEMLSNYDLFLFPTYWEGEGFPGVVIDSFVSGTPVIASNWNHNEELIEHKVNGLIFESKNVDDFEDKINILLEDPALLFELSKNAYNEANEYHIDNVLSFLKKPSNKGVKK